MSLINSRIFYYSEDYGMKQLKSDITSLARRLTNTAQYNEV